MSQFDRERQRIQQDYQKHQRQLEQQRRDAHARVSGAAREELSELERRRQELLGEARTLEQRRERLKAIGQTVPLRPIIEEKARVESEAKKIEADIARAKKEADAEIAKAVTEPKEELETWRDTAMQELDTAEAEFRAANVELSTGEWVPREDFKELSKEHQDKLKSLGVEKFNQAMAQEQRTEEVVAPDFAAGHVRLDTGEYVTRESFEALDPHLQLALKMDGADKFNAMVEQVAADFEKNHVEIKPGEWIVKSDWEKLTPAQQIEVKQTGYYTLPDVDVSVDAITQAAAQSPRTGVIGWLQNWWQSSRAVGELYKDVTSADKQAQLKQIYELQQATPKWQSLVADSPLMLLTFIPNYENLPGIGDILKQTVASGIVGLPMVVYYPNEDRYVPVLRMEVTDKRTALAKAATSAGQARVVTKGPAEVGMTQAQFDRFLAARVQNPNVTPEWFKITESLAGVKPAVTTVGKASPLRPAIPAKPPLVQPRGPLVRPVRRWEAAPSLAKVMSQRLPQSAQWRPPGQIPVWPKMAPSTYQQAIRLSVQTPSQWAKLAGPLIQATRQLAIGSPRITAVIGGIATVGTPIAHAAAIQAFNQAKAAGATDAQAVTKAEQAAQSALQSHVKGVTDAAVQAGTITKAEAATITNLYTKPLTATTVQQLTKTAPVTKTQPVTKTKPVTKTVTKTVTATKPVTKKPVKKKPPKKVPLPDKKKKKEKKERKAYPAGTIAWRQGAFWKIIPPPYDLKKPIHSTVAPEGVARLSGTPQETLTFIKGKLPFGNVSFDLGVVDGFIDVKKKTINFTGGGLETVVGKRKPEPTRGLSLEKVRPRKTVPKRRRVPTNKAQRRKIDRTASAL